MQNEADTVRFLVLDGRSSKALAEACADGKSGRPTLTYARVRKDGRIEATNGHILVRMKPTMLDKEERAANDLPEDVPDWRICRDDLKRPNVSDSLRLDLETGEIVILDNHQAPKSVVPGGAVTEEEAGVYPDTDRIYNAEEGTPADEITIKLSGTYLKVLAKLGKAAGGKWSTATEKKRSPVTLTVRKDRTMGGGGPMPRPVMWKTGNDRSEGLLMPMVD